MKSETTTRVTRKTAGKGKTDFVYLDSLTDEQLRDSIKGDPDWEGNEEIDWENGHWVIPEPKTPISIRLEPDILAFFKEQGPGYQKRIHAVLRHYVDQMRAKKKAG